MRAVSQQGSTVDLMDIDPIDTAADALADVRELSLASLSSMASAGLLDRDQLHISGAGVSVAAFNSSI